MSIVQLEASPHVEAAEVIPLSLHMTTEVQSRIPPSLRGTPFQISFIYNLQQRKVVHRLFKRTMDIGVSLFSLCLLAVPLGLLAIIVKMNSPGPFLFKQKRVGLHGKTFYMYKIRSMYADAEERLAELLEHNEIKSGMFKMQNDPRITPVGKLLRKYSLDELPQLINVLKGEMSLVGPRPPLERELQDYKDWHYIRFSVLPGLTGEWQVSGRSSIKNFDDVVSLDFKYIRYWSFWKDIKILLKTIPVIFWEQNTA
jgi:lipopolysaccharide/colanic/teichoic acid biosynthesis glycosyltransferase